MDNTTEQQNMQGNMSTEDLRAAVGFSTNLMSQMLPKDEMTDPNAPQDGKTPQGGEMSGETDKDHMGEEMTKMEGKMDEKMEILRTELKETIKTEIGSIRDEIKSAIEDEN